MHGETFYNYYDSQHQLHMKIKKTDALKTYIPVYSTSLD